MNNYVPTNISASTNPRCINKECQHYREYFKCGCLPDNFIHNCKGYIPEAPEWEEKKVGCMIPCNKKDGSDIEHIFEMIKVIANNTEGINKLFKKVRAIEDELHQ